MYSDDKDSKRDAKESKKEDKDSKRELSTSSSRDGSGRTAESDLLGSRNNVVVKIGMLGDAQVISPEIALSLNLYLTYVWIGG